MAAMVNTHCTHSWLGSFAGRLIQLRPAMNIGAAVQYAVMSIHHASDLDPLRAAELFVLANPPATPIRARRAERQAEAPAARYRSLFGQRLSAFAASASDRAGRAPRTASPRT